MATVLITGCSSGFGKLSALHFARKGDTVFASMRNTAKAGELEQAKQAESLPIEIVQLDVTDDASVEGAVRQVIDAAGSIDVLVNNAGLGIHGPLEETDDDEMKEIFETNFFGAMRVTRAVTPKMREQKSGTIVNISSLAGRVVAPYGGIYSASKYALEAASEALHYELHPFGIRVLLIEPGGFETEFDGNRRLARRFTEGSPYLELEQRFEQSLTRLPGGNERGDAQDVAEAIYNAVNTDQPKFRYLVGQDAELIGGLRRQMDDEQFEQAMRQTLDFWD
ncbi:MAG: SDR family oxidoreductase [Chloroflexi bacterium]|nr:SDR family oxidoreductase [Chloroflexota bacterium]